MGRRSRGLPVPPFDSTAAVVVEAGQAEHAARAQLPVQCAQGRRRRQRRPGPGGRRNALHGNTRQRVSAAEVLGIRISQGMLHYLYINLMRRTTTLLLVPKDYRVSNASPGNLDANLNLHYITLVQVFPWKYPRAPGSPPDLPVPAVVLRHAAEQPEVLLVDLGLLQ